jgi:hypothetical protein
MLDARQSAKLPMRNRATIFLVSTFLFLGALLGSAKSVGAFELPAEVRAVLDNPDRLELLSLQPVDEDAPDFDEQKGFHGHASLGSVQIKAAAKNKLIAALKKGIGESEGAGGCFIPRHGIRATRNGTTVELVICFQCSNVHIYLDGKPTEGTGTVGEPQAAFDAILKKAKIPLADPKATKGSGVGFF